MRLIRLAIAFITIVCFAGCATLFASGPDSVQVASTPPGARVTVDGQEVGVTPTAVTLDRGRSQGNIRIEAPGYQPVTVMRSKSFNTTAILNCLNILFWVIDLATSNVNQFDTTPINVNLVPMAAPGYPAPAAGGSPPQQPPQPEPIR